MTRDMILKPWEVTRALEELYLRPAVKAVKDARGNVKLVERDSDSEWLTITDVAAVLQKPVSAVREMCKSRAQKGLHALPFIRINGKGVRFNRAKITEWLEGMPDNHSRPRRRVTQEKKAHPERFCAAAKCLWRVSDRKGKPLKPCPKHPA